MTTMDSPGDILLLLHEDHRQLEMLLAEFDTVPVGKRNELFWKLVNELARHEVAEEVVMYPALRQLPGGAEVADARIAEQAIAERKLADMERLDAAGAEFAEQMLTLRSAVLSHARAEEASAFEILRAAIPEVQRLEMGARYVKAKSAAPTHPHPHAPDRPPGNVVLGPVAALLDKIRDRARQRAA